MSSRIHHSLAGSVTTTDASTVNVTALSFILPSDTTCPYKLRFQIRAADGSSAYVVFEGLGKNVSGTVSEVGSANPYGGIKADSSPTDLSTVGGGSMHFDTGAVSAYPQVAGIVATTLVWKFWIDWWVL